MVSPRVRSPVSFLIFRSRDVASYLGPPVKNARYRSFKQLQTGQFLREYDHRMRWYTLCLSSVLASLATVRFGHGSEDASPVIVVEVADVFGGKQWPPVLVAWPRRRQHRRDQPARARPRDQVEVVRYPSVFPVALRVRLLLHLLHAYATTVTMQSLITQTN